MELRVLIPTISVLGILLILTFVLLIIIIVRTYRRRQKIREWQQHGIVEDDYSIAWSQEGLTRGVSVREGKLVRNSSRHNKSKDSIRTTIETVREENEMFTAMRDMGSLEFMNSISHITGRISPGIGRALSIGSHKTSALSSEKSRQVSPLPTHDEDQTHTVQLVDIKKRSAATGRKQSSNSSGSRQSYHDTRVPEDKALQDRDSILLPSPPSSVRIATPTRSRHSRQSHSNSSFTYTPATPRASISLFPLTAPPGQQRKSPAAAQAATANLANHVFPNQQYSPRRPSFLQASFSYDRGPTSPSTSAFDTGNSTLANYTDELTPQFNYRPSKPRIQIPATKATAPHSLSATPAPDNSSSSSSQYNQDNHAHNENLRKWSFFAAYPVNDGNQPNFPGPYNNNSKPVYNHAPSSAVGLPDVSPPRKESVTLYAQVQEDTFRKDSFGPVALHRESHGPSTLRRDSTASFMGSPPKFATGPRVYNVLQAPAAYPQRESTIRNYSDRSLQGNHLPSSGQGHLDTINMIPYINESKSSIVSVSSTGSGASEGFNNGGLSPPPIQKASFEGTRDNLSSIDFAFNTKLQQQKPSVTPPWHGKPFDASDDYDTSPSHRRLGKGFFPETVDETNEIPPVSPTSTVTTATINEKSGEENSPDRPTEQQY